MADTEKASNHVTPSSSNLKDGQNEYITIVTKKVRSLSKKMSKIADIEKKAQSGVAINAEQTQLLSKKDITAKSLKEFESLKSQFTKVYNQEEKTQSKLKKKEEKKEKGEVVEQVRVLIDLLQVSSLLSVQEIRARVEQDQKVGSTELNGIVTVANLISQRQANQTSDEGVSHALRYVNQSEENINGLTYKRIREALELLRSSAFLYPQAAAPAQNAPAETKKEEQVVTAEVPASPEQNHDVVSEPAEKSESEVDVSEEGTTTQEDINAETTESGQDSKGDFQNKAFRGRGRGGRGRGRGGRGGRGGYYNQNRGDFNRGEGFVPRDNYNRGGEGFRGRGDNRPRGNRGRGFSQRQAQEQ